jgi:hypothetical protein
LLCKLRDTNSVAGKTVLWIWCSILKIVRTHFAACLPVKALATEGGGEENPPRENPKMRRSRAADNFKFFFGGKFFEEEILEIVILNKVCHLF